MALVLHKRLQDGSFLHEEFSKGSWERALRDESLAGCWGHAPDDCHDPVGRHWSRLRREGFPMSVERHRLADRAEPDWEGDRTVGAARSAAAEERRVVEWPPPGELWVWLLRELAGLCESDARAILRGPDKFTPRKFDDDPPVDKKGQFLLFT